ncbi:MAG: putative Fe-S oxidoreductase [Promethearchaeota archaeon]|nr:MAG: putative Fe-S oxidoreductase [Candidatus Lokiarchaeota archaeon]
MTLLNPVELTKKVRAVVCKDNLRKYYRFRNTKFYGGCATADCLGCNLRCIYCWSQKKVWKPRSFGQFYAPKEVATKFLSYKQPLVRISGGEPTLCRTHLIKVLELIPSSILFILETNGLLFDESYIRDLSKFTNLFVRVSLKGINDNTFQIITGAQGKYFSNQLKALQLLRQYKIQHRAAIIPDLFIQGDIANLDIKNIEYESLISYPFITKALEKKGIELPLK